MIVFRIIPQATKRLLGGRRAPFFIFLSLTLLVVLPLFLKPGFIFLLDWAPTPQPTHIQWGPADNYIIFNFVWWFLDFLFPIGSLQKILLALSFFIAGFGMFRLSVYINIRMIDNWSSYFGGIFYMFNPFVYSRVLTGQWTIVTAYALLPWLFLSLLHFIKILSFRSVVSVALWWTMIIFLNIHIGLLALLLLFFVSIFSLFFSLLEERKLFFKFLRHFFMLLFIFFVLNIHWIFPVITRRSMLNNYTKNVINQTDIFSFFTRTDPHYGVLWNTAAMYGFWGDDDMRYVPQKMFVSYWFYLFFAIFALVLWGTIVSLRKCSWCKRDSEKLNGVSFTRVQDDNAALDFFQWWIVIPLILTGLVAFFFAVGVSYEPFKPPILWFYHHVPFFKGFREPQKFVALLVFVYAIFGAVGVDDLLGRAERIKNKRARIFELVAPAFFLLIPLAYSPGMLWGFHGQIKPSNYPESWFVVDQQLQNDADDFRVLFLPWHQYIYLKFARTVIANPAERFFHKPTIAGDNIEFGPIYTQSKRPESKYIEQKIIRHGKDFINKEEEGKVSLGETLRPLKIKYIIMAKDSDAFNYTYVQNSPDMKLIYDSQELALYENIIFGKQ